MSEIPKDEHRVWVMHREHGELMGYMEGGKLTVWIPEKGRDGFRLIGADEISDWRYATLK